MFETTVQIHGMLCGMCEAHINDVLRANFPVKKVSSSHKKGQAVLLSAEPPDEAALRRTIQALGYEVSAISIRRAEEKKGLFALLKK